MKAWIAWSAWITALFPVVGSSCEFDDRRRCQEQIAQLVSYRAEAIANAFGHLSAATPAQVTIRFIGLKDPERALLDGGIGYDPEQHILMLGREAVSSTTPNPMRWAAYYWPYYDNETYRQQFPIIEAIDNALWSVFLQGAAKRNGLTWPHKNCLATDLSKRLPCEMLLTAIARHVKVRRELLFNENRLDRIWPENFQTFQQRAWRRDDAEYLDVQRYGGILLVRPLIGEFGVPRVLAYIAQTPFEIEDNNLRISALRYQDRARTALHSADAHERAQVAQASSNPSHSPQAATRTSVRELDSALPH